MDMAPTMHRSPTAVDPENPLDVPGDGPDAARPRWALVVAAVPAERPHGDALVAVAARNRWNIVTKRRDDAPRSTFCVTAHVPDGVCGDTDAGSGRLQPALGSVGAGVGLVRRS